MQHEVTITIDPTHPALKGHFPGNPVVPAVVILGHVFEVVQNTLGSTVQVLNVPHAKFVSPLKPGEALTIHVDPKGKEEVRFICRVDSRLISMGTLKFKILGNEYGRLIDE